MKNKNVIKGKWYNINKKIKKRLTELCLQDQVLIEVDGGIKLHNAKEVIDAGADVLVAGSAVFGTSDPVQTIKDFYNLSN